MRLSLADDYGAIYIYNLRGNARTAGELRKKEAGNIFGSASRSSRRGEFRFSQTSSDGRPVRIVTRVEPVEHSELAWEHNRFTLGDGAVAEHPLGTICQIYPLDPALPATPAEPAGPGQLWRMVRADEADTNFGSLRETLLKYCKSPRERLAQGDDGDSEPSDEDQTK